MRRPSTPPEERAVMFTGLSGLSGKAAEFGIDHFLQIIYESQRTLVPCIDRCDGILLKSEGDSIPVIFRRAAKAIECAAATRRARCRAAGSSRSNSSPRARRPPAGSGTPSDRPRIQ